MDNDASSIGQVRQLTHTKKIPVLSSILSTGSSGPRMTLPASNIRTFPKRFTVSAIAIGFHA